MQYVYHKIVFYSNLFVMVVRGGGATIKDRTVGALCQLLSNRALSLSYHKRAGVTDLTLIIPSHKQTVISCSIIAISEPGLY